MAALRFALITVLRFVLITGIGATLVALCYYPLPVVLTAALTGAIIVMPLLIVAMPLLLPLRFILTTVFAGVLFVVLALPLVMLVETIGPGGHNRAFGLLCVASGAAFFLILLGQLLRTLWRGNADHLSAEALATQNYREPQNGIGGAPVTVYGIFGQVSPSVDCGSSSCSSSACSGDGGGSSSCSSSAC
jgi:hypothetical protein